MEVVRLGDVAWSHALARDGTFGRAFTHIQTTMSCAPDVAGVELGHHGEECSFDAIVKKYNINDKAIGRLALIVRGADTPRRDLTLESSGLEAIAEGFRRLAAAEGYDDHETIRRERHLYDALYLYCGGDPGRLRRD